MHTLPATLDKTSFRTRSNLLPPARLSSPDRHTHIVNQNDEAELYSFGRDRLAYKSPLALASFGPSDRVATGGAKSASGGCARAREKTRPRMIYTVALGYAHIPTACNTFCSVWPADERAYTARRSRWFRWGKSEFSVCSGTRAASWDVFVGAGWDFASIGKNSGADVLACCGI